MNVMMAFGWASIMLLVGTLLRAKCGILKRMIVPSAVIAGILGLVFVNVMAHFEINAGTDSEMFTSIVNQLFTVSFISITLMDSSDKKENKTKTILKGALGIGLIWCFLYALTPLIGGAITSFIGGNFNMPTIYGMLIPFAFCQGPGQSVTYGTLIEQYGWENACMTALTFSTIGFIVAFLCGIPAARYGIKKGLAKKYGQLDEITLRGYMKPEEKTASAQKDTFCSSNIETLSFHFGVIGLCYIMAQGISEIFALIPGLLGTSMSSLMFLNGMYAAYIVKFIMRRMRIDYLLDNTLQNKITGWTADYLVVCSFMAVSVYIISAWLIPIFIISAVVTAITFAVCLFFCQRLGADNDFERFLGTYGMSTGTAPTGIALIRVVDPDFQTATCVELGACNPIANICNIPIYLMILAYSSGEMTLMGLYCGLGISSVLFLIALKVTGCWGKKTFIWK